MKIYKLYNFLIVNVQSRFRPLKSKNLKFNSTYNSLVSNWKLANFIYILKNIQTWFARKRNFKWKKNCIFSFLVYLSYRRRIIPILLCTPIIEHSMIPLFIRDFTAYKVNRFNRNELLRFETSHQYIYMYIFLYQKRKRHFT